MVYENSLLHTDRGRIKGRNMVAYVPMAIQELFLICFVVPLHIYACVLLWSHDEIWEGTCTPLKALFRTVSVLSLFNSLVLFVNIIVILTIDPKDWLAGIFAATIPLLLMWIEFFGVRNIPRLEEYERG